jgi:predicted nucleotidyltransferase
MDGWATTQFARSFGSATAAKPIARKTADHALSQLLERVNQVNTEERFLAKVTKLVVLGSYLRADVDRLSDLDIAVELQPKEANWDRLRELTLNRVEQLEIAGRRFNWIEIQYWWHLEAFRFLKSRSRAISLIDYTAEKKFVDSVPVLRSERPLSASPGTALQRARTAAHSSQLG